MSPDSTALASGRRAAAAPPPPDGGHRSVVQGTSTQARDGATRAGLDAAATLFLRAWP
ncbi:hypothetical protein ACIBI0_38095 [Microbispora rosea]|uniref:hypothetical protein n=1 Tax=Microbispora rosea TaxID=58117 RepID=UPI0037948364